MTLSIPGTPQSPQASPVWVSSLRAGLFPFKPFKSHIFCKPQLGPFYSLESPSHQSLSIHSTKTNCVLTGRPMPSVGQRGESGMEILKGSWFPTCQHCQFSRYQAPERDLENSQEYAPEHGVRRYQSFLPKSQVRTAQYGIWPMRGSQFMFV